jgi:4-hydroxy-3-methylbut-2-enyl diphosphate reductase
MEYMPDSLRREPREPRVLLAKPRGYCAGVDRAVQAVETALERYGPPVYVRRQIVHNTYVVSQLEKRGAIFVNELDEVPEGAVIVFSAHGIAPEVRTDAERRQLKTIDATCPLVTKVHNEARRFAAKDYDILLIGHAGHEEVVGTTGEAPDRVRLVDGPDSVAAVEVKDPSRLVWLSQTTLSVDETIETVHALKAKFPNLLDPPSDDICYATQNRQAAVKQIAKDADLVIVVGSPNSSNSVRLVEVARDAGAAAAYLVDDASEVDAGWLGGVRTVGVTSGASVPEELVEAVLNKLSEHGFGAVEEVEAVEERMSFAPPRELRRQRTRLPSPQVSDQVGDLAGQAAAGRDHQNERRANEQPRCRPAQRDQYSGGGAERARRGEQLSAHACAEEDHRRAYRERQQRAALGVPGHRGAAGHEGEVGDGAPAGPVREQQGEKAAGEQPQHRPACGELNALCLRPVLCFPILGFPVPGSVEGLHDRHPM